MKCEACKGQNRAISERAALILSPSRAELVMFNLVAESVVLDAAKLGTPSATFVVRTLRVGCHLRIQLFMLEQEHAEAPTAPLN